MDVSNFIRAKQFIDELDLTPIVHRLITVSKWSKKQAIEACQQYKNYLYLVKKYGEQYTLPPSIDVDEVWHAHILHTEEYLAFCKQVFGGFLHHHPGHTDGKAVSAESYEAIFEQHTQRFYYEEFNDYLYAVRPIPLKIQLALLTKKLKNLIRTKKA